MKFENIYTGTEENMRLALLSLWTPGNHPMRKAIENLLTEEPLLAEPVFQSTFGWEQTHDESWQNSLNKEVIKKFGIGSQYKPYKHQAESWKALSENKSIVVTSGTGSGKTECFMYPVLSDLYEQKNLDKSNNAIQAIFLYPLNALMEDQKKRLSSYCKGTGLKFAVYNGNTPEFRADGRDEYLDNEVLTREEIRDPQNRGTRPQILLSNPSMLEYILVRQSDQEMLKQSAGKLRWIIIDEAHSYSGSAAVELAYQIKRILKAFDVKADQVRFACTSATIGGEEGAKSLVEFISTIVGQETSQIQVIGGNRSIPELDEELLKETLLKSNLPSSDRVLSLRHKINEVAGMSLRQIWEWLNPDSEYSLLPALRLLDTLCELRQEESSVLSLRAHFFMRSINGLYACANEDCKKGSDTPYGHLTTYKSTICSCCGAPLLELVQCKRCGEFILMGDSNNQTHIISPCEDKMDYDDYFSIDSSLEQDELEEKNSVGTPERFFLLPYNKEKSFNPLMKANLSILNISHHANNSTLDLCLSQDGHWFEVRRHNEHSYCPSCGKLAYGKRLNFKHFRIPINFINQTISPVFLSECATDGRSWGKYIAFTDSRQGTAISAKTFNINAERIQCRGGIMKMLAEREPLSDEEIIASLDEKVKSYILTINEEVKKGILTGLRSNMSGDNNGKISLKDTSDGIYDENIFNHIANTNHSDKNAYKAALIRNFIGRRPLYETNIESMGLVTLEYPALRLIKRPSSLNDYIDSTGIKLEDKDWHNYLKLMLDYFVRMGNHIQPLIDGEREYIRDANLSTPFAGPGNPNKNANHWPSLKTDKDGNVSASQHKMVVLLCAGLKIESYDDLQNNSRFVQNILKDAFSQLVDNKILSIVKADDKEGYNHPYFHKDDKYVGCYYLDLSCKTDNKTAYLKRTKEAWVCPVTGALLDTIFCGYSPLISGEISKKLFDKYQCKNETVKMPKRPVDDGTVDSWLEKDPSIKHLKEIGLWSDRYKYTYKKYPSYIAAEHSAQQPKSVLKKYTAEFSQKNPLINVLHCSTTMEMGVDIGDIDVVLMDTVPPTAANYLQRVGRAGRAKQSKALAFSLCNNTPVGQYAFANPMWALETKNHMIKVLESQTIVQRHINSFFFRQFICKKGTGIPANISVDQFMTNIYEQFIIFLDDMSTDAKEEQEFHSVFGDKTRFTIDVTRQCISDIHGRYSAIINELEDVFKKYENDKRRKIAVSNQIKKCKEEGLLKYLSTNQFIPNANMPTDVVTFDFTDFDQASTLFDCYKIVDKLQSKKRRAQSPSEISNFEQELSGVITKINSIRRSTTASRDIHTALNEYAPEQTVVVNEKNYVSAGILLFGAYNESTQTKAIYHCTHCGYTEYSDNLDETKVCPVCKAPYHGIVDPENSSYTRAYEPIGFRTDQSKESTREEKTKKTYYDIRPLLLNTDWSHAAKLNMCEVISSGDNGSILFYNVGSGNGFAFCKRCGRSAIEFCKESSDKTIPLAIKPGHNRLWGDSCDANKKDIARHVVFTGRHQTCYSVMRFKKYSDSSEYENDEQLVFSLGVIITRTLAKCEGIDESEIGFGVKQEHDSWVLFIYDTAKGGCGYSLRLSSPTICQEIFALAKSELKNSPCNCEEEGGACAKCLIDLNNYRYASKLSKGKALDWLSRQNKKAINVPEKINDLSPLAKACYQSLKSIAKQAIETQEVSSIIICVSDNTSDYSVNDWVSIKSEMGRLIKKAIENGKKVLLNVEYHSEFHLSSVDKLPFVDLQTKMPDCEVAFISDMGNVKTAIIVETPNDLYRYFTTQEDALSFSNNWGNDCEALYIDHNMTIFKKIAAPTYVFSPKEILRQGFSLASTFLVKNYFSEAIAPGILKKNDIDALGGILKNKNVNITFSDLYVNSALASLMLVYLIKEMKDIFKFNIKHITLQLDSPRRNCNNERFNDYTYISHNFDNKERADKYTDGLIKEVLGIDAEHSLTVDHHRWLKIITEDNGVVEIRPDHGISGGWSSKSSYMNIDNLDGNVRVYKKRNEDILYYIIINKNRL